MSAKLDEAKINNRSSAKIKESDDGKSARTSLFRPTHSNYALLTLHGSYFPQYPEDRSDIERI